MWIGIPSSSTPTSWSRPCSPRAARPAPCCGLCLRGRAVPLIGQALFAEYEDVFARDAPFAKSLLDRPDRDALLDAFLAVCRWTRVSYLWRPNLRDEADNHLVELAVAGGASAIVTGNARDVATGELRFDRLAVLSPAAYLAAHRSETL